VPWFSHIFAVSDRAADWPNNMIMYCLSNGTDIVIVVFGFPWALAVPLQIFPPHGWTVCQFFCRTTVQTCIADKEMKRFCVFVFLQSTNQSIKTHLYSAICRKRIGAYIVGWVTGMAFSLLTILSTVCADNNGTS